jgi:uncharacterized protein YkwD
MPRTMTQAIAFLLGFWIALLLSPFTTWASGLEETPFSGLETELHRAVNADRAARHLLLLERRADLDVVARAHSSDMARRSYLSHVTPEGVDPLGRLKRAGVEGFSLAGENAGQTSKRDPSREILVGWLASPVHRQNLHAPPWNATGIGIAKGADGTLYYTQLYVTYPR